MGCEFFETDVRFRGGNPVRRVDATSGTEVDSDNGLLVEENAMRRREQVSRIRRRGTQLRVENLEGRVLLSHGGPEWPHPERITVSFVPDGTEWTMNGTTEQSVLQQAISSQYDWATWKKEFLRGLYAWAQYANINFALVSDDGSAIGSAGSTSDHNVQGDVDFGDIRIGMWTLPWSSTVAGAYLPPPNVTTTEAGDITLNESYKNSSYFYPSFVKTVAAHEAGHALGLGHISGSVIMNPTLTTYEFRQVDIDAIQEIYGPRQHDSFDQGGRGNSMSTPINVTNRLDSQYRYTFNGVDITTPTDRDWYKIRIPSGAGDELLVRMHTHKLSMLAPRLVLYDANGNQIKAVNGEYGKTITLRKKVRPGQVYYVKATGRGTDEFSVGAYALMVRISNAPLLPVQVPNTATPAGNTSGTPQSALAAELYETTEVARLDVAGTTGEHEREQQEEVVARDAVLASDDAAALAYLTSDIDSLLEDSDAEENANAVDPLGGDLLADALAELSL